MNENSKKIVEEQENKEKCTLYNTFGVMLKIQVTRNSMSNVH